MLEKQSAHLQLGQLRFDTVRRELRTSNGELQPLRAQSAEVLAVLAANANALVTKDALFEAVWPDVSVTEDSLTQCIADIRRAIGDTDRTLLRTVPKKGYQLAAVPVEHTPPQIIAKNGSERQRGRAYLAALALLILGVVSFSLWFLQTKKDPDAVQLASIIVLPFVDLSPEKDFQYFADGMSEDITTELARWRELKVIARNSALTYKDKALDVRQIAKEMGVRYVLEGSVRRADRDAVRINAQLIDGETGAHVWAERFDQSGTNVLALQDQITSKLADTLGGSRGQIKAAQYKTAWEKSETELEEYDYYLRGHDLFYRYTPADMKKARETWEAGLQRFPNSGLLTIKVGISHYLEASLNWAPDPVAKFKLAAELLNKGMADPNLPSQGLRFGLWTQINLSLFYFRDCDRALRFTDRLIEVYPYDAESLVFEASGKAVCGQIAEAGTLMDRAFERLPIGDANQYNILARVRYREGKFEQTLEALSKSIPNLENLYLTVASEVALGHEEPALEAVDRLSQRFPDLTPDALLDMIPDRDRSVARGIADKLEQTGWPSGI